MNDEEDELYRSLRGKQRRRKILVVVLISLFGAAPFLFIGSRYFASWRERKAELLDEKGEEELGRLLDKIDQGNADCEAAWAKVATRDTLARIAPGERECPVSLNPPELRAADSYIEYGSIDTYYFGSWSLRMVRPGEEIGSGSCGVSDWSLKNTRNRLVEGEADKQDLRWAQTEASHPGGAGYITILLVEEETKPAVAVESFVPGYVRGRAYLYSEARRRFICAADVSAINNKNVKIRYSYNANNVLDKQFQASMAAGPTLQRDLEVQVRRAVAEGMRAVETAPPAP